MLISLYRTTIKCNRWYLKVLFHCVDISKVNAWLLYRQHCTQLNVPKRSQLSLLKFTTAIASGLINTNTVTRSVGRPSKRKSEHRFASQKDVSRQLLFQLRMFDLMMWHIGQNIVTRKTSAVYAKQEPGRVYCKKCGLCLCLNNSRNCFYDFHNK